VTGCNSGLGLESLRVLSLRGAHVIAAARSEEKAASAIAQVSADGTPVACELSQPDAVRACVAQVRELGRPLDGMICNAGIMALPKLQQKLGYELQFITNHIGHFILVTGLLEQLTEKGRVVMLSSGVHTMAPDEGIQFDNLNGERGYKPWKAYGQSKLANLLFARQLARRLQGSNQTANAVHPGVIRTNLGRHMGGFVNGMFAFVGPLFTKSVAQGAATQCYVATHPSLATISGRYFADCNEAPSSRQGRDERLAERLWTTTEEIVGRVMCRN
jgi:NAD(P)-dependent dehydrogenase (short-subunit alcohol dehydrogenase family)